MTGWPVVGIEGEKGEKKKKKKKSTQLLRGTHKHAQARINPGFKTHANDGLFSRQNFQTVMLKMSVD